MEQQQQREAKSRPREFKRGREEPEGDAFLAVPKVRKGDSLPFQSRSEEGTRKRKAQVQVGEGSIREFFASVAQDCQERKQRLTRCTQVSSHDTLCSVLLSHDIQPSLPLQQIYALTAKVARNEPAIHGFRLQWEEYVRYVHAASAQEKQQRAAIDSEWFEKQLGRITFSNVFSCYLWSKTTEQQEEFDMFASGSIAESRRKPEELLKPEDILDSEAPRDALAVIMSHLENREVRARAKVLSVAFRDWLAKHKSNLIDCLPAELKMDDPPGLFKPLAARTALEGLVRDQREKWAKLYEAEGDAVSARSQEWEREASELLAQKRAAHTAELEVLKQKMSVHIRLSAYGHWTARILAAVTQCNQGLLKCTDDATVFNHVRSNWPTPCQERQAKRLKLFRDAPREEKAEQQQQPAQAGETLEVQVEAVLKSGFAHIESETDDELSAFSGVLEQLIPVLREHAKLKVSKEPLAERKIAFENAVIMDFAEFGKVVAERAANQAQIIVQRNIQPAFRHIEELEKFEEDLIKSTLEGKPAAFRVNYAAVYDKIRGCFVDDVWGRLRKRADKLREFDEKQRGTVVLYEPWLDRTLLTPDQQQQLRAMFPDLPSVPQTISTALIQSSAWLEQLYAAECGE